MLALEVKEDVGAHAVPGSDGDVGVLHAVGSALDDDLFEVAVAGPDEGHREVAGGGGGHGGQVAVEGENGLLDDRKFATQGRVDVEPAEVLADLGELGVDAAQTGGYEV